MNDLIDGVTFSERIEREREGGGFLATGPVYDRCHHFSSAAQITPLIELKHAAVSVRFRFPYRAALVSID